MRASRLRLSARRFVVIRKDNVSYFPQHELISSTFRKSQVCSAITSESTCRPSDAYLLAFLLAPLHSIIHSHVSAQRKPTVILFTTLDCQSMCLQLRKESRYQIDSSVIPPIKAADSWARGEVASCWSSKDASLSWIVLVCIHSPLSL